jgi:hypothetical protein
MYDIKPTVFLLLSVQILNLTFNLTANVSKVVEILPVP